MGQVFSPKTLFLRDSWVQIPPPAYFVSPHLLDALIKLLMMGEVRGTKMIVAVATMPTRNRVTYYTFVQWFIIIKIFFMPSCPTMLLLLLWLMIDSAFHIDYGLYSKYFLIKSQFSMTACVDVVNMYEHWVLIQYAYLVH
jgi:hypothetical protein